MLTHKTQVESTKLGCKEGLSVLKAVDAKDIKYCHLLPLYQGVILSVFHCDIGLTTLPPSARPGVPSRSSHISDLSGDTVVTGLPSFLLREATS